MNTIDISTRNVLIELLETVTYDDIKKKLNNIANLDNNSSKNKSVDFWNYAKMKYIDACCWLIDETEKIVDNMILHKKDSWSRKYSFDMGMNTTCPLSLITNPEINTNIEQLPESWNKMGYTLPFFFVKKLMEKKGYIINTYSSCTHPNKVKNDKIYNHFIDSYDNPTETYLLEININANANANTNEDVDTNKISGKRRERDS